MVTEAESNRVAVVSIIIVILGGAIGLAITVYIVRSINRPLHSLVEAIGQRDHTRKLERRNS